MRLARPRLAVCEHRGVVPFQASVGNGAPNREENLFLGRVLWHGKVKSEDLGRWLGVQDHTLPIVENRQAAAGRGHGFDLKGAQLKGRGEPARGPKLLKSISWQRTASSPVVATPFAARWL